MRRAYNSRVAREEGAAFQKAHCCDRNCMLQSYNSTSEGKRLRFPADTTGIANQRQRRAHMEVCREFQNKPGRRQLGH